VKIVVPYVDLANKTREALEAHAPAAQYHYLDPADDGAYHHLLVELWDAGEDFAIVEHDIEIHAGVLPAFEACPESWCVFPYFGRPHKNYPVPVLRVALGCTRFRAEFLKTNAGILTAMLPGPQNTLRNPKHWRRQDSLLASALQRRGFRAHEHEPHVVHHHDYANDPPAGRV